MSYKLQGLFYGRKQVARGAFPELRPFLKLDPKFVGRADDPSAEVPTITPALLASLVDDEEVRVYGRNLLIHAGLFKKAQKDVVKAVAFDSHQKVEPLVLVRLLPPHTVKRHKMSMTVPDSSPLEEEFVPTDLQDELDAARLDIGAEIVSEVNSPEAAAAAERVQERQTLSLREAWEELKRRVVRDN